MLVILLGKILNRTSRAVAQALITHYSNSVIPPAFRTIRAISPLYKDARRFTRYYSAKQISLAYAKSPAESVARDMVEVIAAELNSTRTLRTRTAKTQKMVPLASGTESGESDLTPLEEDSEDHRKKFSKLHPNDDDVLRKKEKVADKDTLSGFAEDLSLLKAKRPFKGTRPKSKKRQAPLMDNTELFDEQPPKKKRRRTSKPEPVYVIPEVERKETTFHGRLGR